MTRRIHLRVAVLLGALISAYCGGGLLRPDGITGHTTSTPTVTATPTPRSRSQPSTAQDVSGFVTGVAASDGSIGVKRAGSAPGPSGGPAAQPAGSGGVINGGSTQTRVHGSSAFQTIYVFVSGVAGGVGGYWEMRLTGATTDTTIVVTLGRSIPSGSFDIGYIVASASGAVGTASVVPTQVIEAATGEVQVSVSWDAASDVDLHLMDPRGAEIYYGNPRSGGGELDLDSNAGCAIDNKNNENIRWPVGRAVSGTYAVRVDYWDSCGASATNYIVTVNNGSSTQTFRGGFNGRGSFGGAGSGRTITTFTRNAGSSVTDAMLLLRLLAPSASALDKTASGVAGAITALTTGARPYRTRAPINGQSAG